MADEDKRREGRFPARIIAHVVRRGEQVELTTSDVSFRGAFLRTDSPPALRQLVKVSFLMPTGEVVSAHAMAVHVVQPGSGNGAPGVGLQFWGPVNASRAWETYVYELKVREKKATMPPPPPAPTVDKVRRSSERFKLALEVIVDKRMLTTRDVSETGMAIRSELLMPIGTRAVLAVHANGHRSVTLDVIVRRQIEEPGFKGLGVEFVGLRPETRGALMAILRPVAIEPDAVYVKPDDPELH